MMFSFTVIECIATEEKLLQSRIWFRHTSLGFVKLKINNNLVKQVIITLQVEDTQILFGYASINIYLCII